MCGEGKGFPKEYRSTNADARLLINRNRKLRATSRFNLKDILTDQFESRLAEGAATNLDDAIQLAQRRRSRRGRPN